MITNKKALSLLACAISFFLLFNTASFGEDERGKAVPEVSLKTDEAIVILTTNTIAEMQLARKVIEKEGGRVNEIFPPNVFIGKIPPAILDSLSETGLFEEISYSKVDRSFFKDYDISCQDTIEVWNKRLEDKEKPKEEKAMTEKEKEPFRDEVIIPKDLPKTQEEKIKKEEEYLKRWDKKKKEFLRSEKSKKAAWESKRGKRQINVDPALLQSVQEDAGSSPAAMVSSTSGFGKAFGAGYYDTSLYMAGDIVVGVFYTGSWTPSEINAVYSTICSALNQFIYNEPNAHITFTYIKEVDGAGNPNPLPSSEGDYVNNLRNTYSTHWAYMIIVAGGMARANAYLFGPSTRLYSEDLRGGYVPRHETMHIFGAMDQYHPDAARSPIDRWGYLYVVNANSEYNDGLGFFDGAGEGQSDIMIGSTDTIGIYSRGQIGWWDSDGDGILDMSDTFPDTVISAKSADASVAYEGTAKDMAMANEYALHKSSMYGNVTLNTINKVQYRIQGGPWQEAAPKDGSFDSGCEGFIFTTPPLKNGNYTVEIRAINSVGNEEISYAKDELTVIGSAITNVQPFAGFSITPKEGSVDTNFTFDASENVDIEDNLSTLQVRWDFENDGAWDTSFSQEKVVPHQYATAGSKTVKLEVKDTGGQSQSITKEVYVSATNTLPRPFFTIRPVSQFGPEGSLTIECDASGSWDGEDALADLKFRWEFFYSDGWGYWSTAYLSSPTISHSFSLGSEPKTTYYLVKLWVKDTNEMISSVSRYVWTNTYDRPPSINSIDLQDVSGLNFILAKRIPLGFKMFIAENYIYNVVFSTFSVVDTSVRLIPNVVGTCAISSQSKDLYVTGDYAYIAAGTSGLQIVSIADPGNPALVGSCATSSYAQDVHVSGDYAYVAVDDKGLDVINVSNPAAPFVVGRYDIPYYAMCVYAVGNYVYLSGSTRFYVINVADKTNPALSGTCYGMYLARDIIVSGDYAYVADSSGGLKIINITDSSHPVLVGNYVTSGYVDSVSLQGNYAYIIDTIFDSPDVLKIIDISNPSSPLLAASYDGVSFGGMTVSGSYIYVKALNDIYIFIYQDAPVLKATVTTSDPDSAATWDGIMELRWDCDNDRVWETGFLPAGDNSMIIPDDYKRDAFTCEVRDRFGATVRITEKIGGPAITNVNEEGITTNSCAITWNTDVPATSVVEYGLDTGYDTEGDSGLVTNHSISLSGLLADTAYHYRVKSADAEGRETVSADYVFTTDTSLPSGSEVSGSVTEFGFTYPIVGARITFTGIQRVYETYTSSSGTYSISGIHSGTYTAKAEKEGCDPDWTYTITVESPQHYTLDLMLQRAITVTGHLTCFGNPINTTFELTRSDGSIVGHEGSRYIVDVTNGDFTIRKRHVDLGEGTITIVLPERYRTQDGSPLTFEITEGIPTPSHITADLKLNLPVLAGMVRGPAGWLEGVKVTIEETGDYAMSGSSWGTFYVYSSSIVSGSYTIKAQKAGYRDYVLPSKQIVTGLPSGPTLIMINMEVALEPAPDITFITPTQGLRIGGTAVTIQGQNFKDGIEVKFGENLSPSVIFISATELTAITPAVSGGGVVSVTVINPDEQSDALPNAFTYIDDLTPPTTPIVTDDGATTTSTTTLHATWTSSDPDTGVVEYQYSIGTSAGSTNIVTWTSTGTSASVTREGLTLIVDTTYYFNVKARNPLNMWSNIGSSDGIRVISSPPQTPWKTNQNGTLRTNQNLYYMYGYKFTPLRNGQITKLGGYFNGTYTVKLWNTNTGQLLGSAGVSSGNSWNYTSITPLNVQAGVSYTVGVCVSGSYASYRQGILPLPRTYGDIRIDDSVKSYDTYSMPDTSAIGNMCGQVDIEYVGE